MKTENPGFLRFLKDEKFIEWQLFPSDEMNAYWEDFLRDHPGERDDMSLAEAHFRNIRLSSTPCLTEKLKEEAIERLEQSVRAFHKKKRIRRLSYVAAACVSVFIVSALYLHTFREHGEEEVIGSGYIVGNELQSEDIQLITHNQKASFQANVNIEIDHAGMAQVMTGAGEDGEYLPMDRTAANTLIVPYGKRSTLTLSDGSKVWLNSGSVLEFPTQFEGSSREISLTSGEMYIEVAPDKKVPFFVHAPGFNVSVYGTKFNLSVYEDIPQSVVLVEGSVGLRSADGNEVKLMPDEQAFFLENGGFITQKVDADRFVSWKNGYLVFDGTPMSDVLKQIERYYNLSFDYDKDVTLKDLTCSGKIILYENLDNVMAVLALLTSTRYHKEDNRIYITNKLE